MLQTVLRNKLQSEGLSSHTAAERIGVSHTTILRALHGDKIDLETLVKVADFLGVRPSELVDSLPNDPESLSNQIAILLSQSPELEALLREAVRRVQDGGISPDAIREVVSFATYKFMTETESIENGKRKTKRKPRSR